MAKPKALVDDGSVDPEFLRETVCELVPLTQAIVGASADDESPGLGEDDFVAYAAERHTTGWLRSPTAVPNCPASRS